MLVSSEGRALVFQSAELQLKSTRSTQGVAVMKLKPKYKVTQLCALGESGIVNRSRYKAKTLPTAGALLRPEDRGEEQPNLFGEE